TFHEWLQGEGIPGIEGVDTRAITKRLREEGTLLGGVVKTKRKKVFRDPNLENLVAEVSPSEPSTLKSGAPVVVVLDCGAKASILRSLLVRGVTVIRVPWNYDFLPLLETKAQGLLISNGPGDPKQVLEAVDRVRAALEIGKPVFGICLGNQILALAAGFDTYKMKYGHRSQNQPCVEKNSDRALITSQNHGYAVDAKSVPPGWELWFTNANDGTVEGVRHGKKPYFAVQFHPEATPGPTDPAYLFDEFVKHLK
ncbi:MAG: carbamoyl phosphate synthase small subunit, partial [Planctomycetota bacterium]